jgi:Insertion element 4 transposase N-terminal/Transposase DDE domain
MSFSLQHLPAEGKLTHVLHLPVLEQVYPRERVIELLTRCHRWEERERKLSQLLMVYYVMCLCWWRPLNLRAVLQQLVAGLRWLWPVLMQSLPAAAALVYRRKQLGVPVLRHLLRQCCGPLATPATPSTFCFGLRLIALDSTLDDVPDSPANVLHFGRLTSGKTRSPFPQVRCLYLAEVGTHGVVDAVFAPCHVSEQRLAPTLLRSLGPGMLLLCDRNFPSADWIGQVRATGADLLARLPADRFLQPERVLADGSYLVTLSPPRPAVLSGAGGGVSPASRAGPGTGPAAPLAQQSPGRSLPDASAGHHAARPGAGAGRSPHRVLP